MKLVILGRDGTLNRYRDDHVKSPAELEPLPGALEAVARLNHAGWHVVLATNQPGIGRGLLDMSALNAVHLRLNELLKAEGGRLDAAFFCPHTPEEGCACRKPLPGLIEQIGERFGADLATVHMVGASLRDLQTAAAAGCVPHLVQGDRLAGIDDERLHAMVSEVVGARLHADLAAFAEWLLHTDRSGSLAAEEDAQNPGYEGG
ncbi:D-glycero-beta-D-manno-heptose 1,7-bisphosphate 7-phosphatase [Inhella gelatinilytica]|uniref:D-glycero-beta-D-manno-heptose-1,7-bisphosphate 7-phosphatase n=1 Tax=Inhella gelatinilytica TaxID=2795030 RepID=A0A931IWD7_9BURK|nr:D-glycero-beta-D-manno-heptose 1,7-bisphosphate 7-phosphatase [Inhella gelatinilytica]MBH9551288.1 D-glycero-beta-D-manno-heptose 1,7-bisphosphate 7-phosphatase [Inhella gelatinilytica]